MTRDWHSSSQAWILLFCRSQGHSHQFQCWQGVVYRNTDGHIVLATWAEMIDNSLHKKVKEDAEKQPNKKQLPIEKKKHIKCSFGEHLIVFLVLGICILLIILLPVFWFFLYEVYKLLWGQGWIWILYALVWNFDDFYFILYVFKFLFLFLC